MNSHQLVREILNLGYLVLVAAGTVTFVYMSMRALTGELPATITVFVLSLVGAYAYAINKKVTKHIDNWLNHKK